LAAPFAAFGQPARQKIVSVRAAAVALLPTSRFGKKEFASDFDPARRRWFGPFSQLAGSVMVEIRTDQGLTGYGLGGGGTAAVHVIENHLRDLLIGANALNVELLWDQMFASTSFYGRRGLPIMAMSGIDLALWDILGKHAGLPVWRLLGGAARERVPAYYTGSGVDRALTLRFRAFKLGLTDDMPRDKLIATLKDMRAKAGSDAHLMIDCLCRWTVEETLDFARRVEDIRLDFIEEPLYPDDVAGYQRLVREVRGTKIASGEHEFTHHGFAELIRNRMSHILQPDLTWTGGLTAGRRIAALAAANGLTLIPHRGGSLCAIHLAIANPEIPFAESFGTGEPGNELMAALTPPFENGYYLAPQKPGLGFEFPPEGSRRMFR
jgi:L-rhamnonate dehydratase